MSTALANSSFLFCDRSFNSLSRLLILLFFNVAKFWSLLNPGIGRDVMGPDPGLYVAKLHLRVTSALS